MHFQLISRQAFCFRACLKNKERCSTSSLCSEKLENTSMVLETRTDTPPAAALQKELRVRAWLTLPWIPLTELGFWERGAYTRVCFGTALHVSASWDRSVPFDGAAHHAYLWCRVAEQTSADAEVRAFGHYSCPLAVTCVAKVMDFKRPNLCSVFKGWVVSFDLQTRGKDRYRTTGFFVLFCFVSVLQPEWSWPLNSLG